MGAYVLQHSRLPFFYLIEHSVWVSPDGSIIDITPFRDARISQFFVKGHLQRRSRLIQSPEFINIPMMQEVETLYYVYCYYDGDVPIYIGKGSGNRAYSHIRDCWKNKTNCRFHNRLKSMLETGQFPRVELLIENIEEEKQAYLLEEDYILNFGRKGYEEHGTLLNTCLGAKPPNHKGRTYKEIYGDRWQEQVEHRRLVQLKRGGFGPKKFSVEFCKERSVQSKGTLNKNFNGLDESQCISFLKDFCVTFEGQISAKKWDRFCDSRGLKPNFRKSFRFSGVDLFEIAKTKFNATVEQTETGLLWFHHPITKQTFRCYEWELQHNFAAIPDGFIRGRGYWPNKKD